MKLIMDPQKPGSFCRAALACNTQKFGMLTQRKSKPVQSGFCAWFVVSGKMPDYQNKVDVFYIIVMPWWYGVQLYHLLYINRCDQKCVIMWKKNINGQEWFPFWEWLRRLQLICALIPTCIVLFDMENYIFVFELLNIGYSELC